LKIIRCRITLDLIVTIAGDYVSPKKFVDMLKEERATIAVAAEVSDSKLLAQYEIGDVLKTKEG